MQLPSEGLASERSHVERPGSPQGSRSCTHLCSFPPSPALSFLPSLSLQLHLPFRSLHSSLFFPAAFLRHTNSPYLSPLSPLCPAPDLLPQFSVQLEFEINPISSDPSTRLALIALPPSLPPANLFPPPPNPLSALSYYLSLTLPSAPSCSILLCLSISAIHFFFSLKPILVSHSSPSHYTLRTHTLTQCIH